MYEQYLLAKKVARYSLRNVLMFCSHQFILHPEFIFARKLQKYNIHALCGLFLSEQNILQGDKIVCGIMAHILVILLKVLLRFCKCALKKMFKSLTVFCKHI